MKKKMKNYSEEIKLINEYLENIVKHEYPYALTESMRYSLLNGGKRLRPLLIFNVGAMLGLDKESLLPFAAGVEMIHTYSLIHDDLPSMDNDDLRRGKPTNHRVFGEANAILAGDALLTHAFYVISQLKANFSADKVLRVIELTALYAGIRGMVAGQSVDINQELLNESIEKTVEFMHLNKTAKMIMLCFEGTAVLSGVSEEKVDLLRESGRLVGLAFQIQDDILDVISTTEELGKPALSDEKNKKLTYLSFYTIDEAKKRVENLIKRAKIIIEENFDNFDRLLYLIELIEQRKK